MDQHLIIVLLPLAGAFILGIGVAAGSWLRGAATDPAHLQVRATNRELLAFRREAHAAMGKAISGIASIINDDETPNHTKRRLEGVQKCLVETTGKTESSR